MLLSSLKEALDSVGKRRAARALEDAHRRSVERAGGLRIVFADSTLAYTADTPYEQPLGGSQAAACYLAEALAAMGHEVVLITQAEEVGPRRGVTCIGWAVTPRQALGDFRADAVIGLIAPAEADLMRRTFGSDARLVLWEHLPHDQPGVQTLGSPAVRDAYDGISFVSEWQSAGYVAHFGIDPSRVRVIGNGVSPAFEHMFSGSENITAAKDRPPVLAYTSAPYRGLNVLLNVFPEIRRRVPGASLKVFSSMRLYQASAEKDAQYQRLYDLCRETDGVEYVGAVPQPQLARELRSVALFAYPNTFAETYCIAALEAMAAGCRIVTSDLGGLPQTTAGFARLIPLAKETFADAFAHAVAESLEESLRGTDADLLSQQVAHVNEKCTWSHRAREWTDWLSSLRRG